MVDPFEDSPGGRQLRATGVGDPPDDVGIGQLRQCGGVLTGLGELELPAVPGGDGDVGVGLDPHVHIHLENITMPGHHSPGQTS